MYSLGSSSSLTVVGSHATSGQDQDSPSSKLSVKSSNVTLRPSESHRMVYEFREKTYNEKEHTGSVDTRLQSYEAQAQDSHTSVRLPLRVRLANRAWRSGYSSSSPTDAALERLTIAALTLHELSKTPISRKVVDVAYVGRTIELLDDLVGVHEDINSLKSRREGMVRRMVESRGVLSAIAEKLSSYRGRYPELSETEDTMVQGFEMLERAFEETIEYLARCIPQSYTDEIGMLFFARKLFTGEIERCEERWGSVCIKFQSALRYLGDETRVS